MLEGWYCRTMANQQATTAPNEEHSDDSQEPQLPTSNARNTEHNGVDYKSRYLLLKRKLKFLIYENEYFQDTLRFNQRRLLKISRDRAFLLDRLLQYEKPGNTSSEGEATESSDDDTTAPHPPQPPKETVRRRKMEGRPAPPGGATRGRKRKIPLNQGNHLQQPLQKQKKLQQLGNQQQQQHQQRPLVTTTTTAATATATSVVEQDKREMQLTTAEITRQLQARKPSAIELMSVECTSATVPATMLSDESPSKCFQTDQPQHYLDGSSPSHVAAEECVPMEYIN